MRTSVETGRVELAREPLGTLGIGGAADDPTPELGMHLIAVTTRDIRLLDDVPVHPASIDVRVLLGPFWQRPLQKPSLDVASGSTLLLDSGGSFLPSDESGGSQKQRRRKGPVTSNLLTSHGMYLPRQVFPPMRLGGMAAPSKRGTRRSLKRRDLASRQKRARPGAGGFLPPTPGPRELLPSVSPGKGDQQVSSRCPDPNSRRSRRRSCSSSRRGTRAARSVPGTE